MSTDRNLLRILLTCSILLLSPTLVIAQLTEEYPGTQKTLSIDSSIAKDSLADSLKKPGSTGVELPTSVRVSDTAAGKLPSEAPVQKSTAIDKSQQIREKIRKLEAKRAQVRNNDSADAVGNKTLLPNRLQELIVSYESKLAKCVTCKSERRAEVLYTLATLYYDKSREDYIKARETFELNREISERNGVTPSDTVSPKPDYSHSLKIYQQLAAEYPDFTEIGETYYQMMTIHSLCGDLAKIKELCITCAERYPQWSPCDRPLQYCDSGGNDSCYLKKLELMKESEMDKSSWEMLHYRKAELNYHIKRFDKAAELFNSYIEKCDSGLYQKCEFRDMSLEFLAISFSEMKDGYLKATDFFKRIGSRSYEPKVMYMIGRKYQSKGRYDEAISALSSVLKRYPDYQDAPAARKDLNDCIDAKKRAKQ